MKLVVFLMLVLSLLSCISEASRTLSFTGKDLPLKEILKVIKTQSGVGFFYDDGLLEDAKPVTIDWKNLQLEQALNEIFEDQPINWVLENRTVTIIKRPVLVRTP